MDEPIDARETETGTTVVGDIEIAHEVRGSGPAFVWGHGLTSSMASEDELGLIDWRAVAASHRLVRYDARGHGASGSSEAPSSYAWEQLARDQLALLDALGIGDYVAGGASMGAATALHAAVAAPERVRAMVLMIPPTGWETRAAQAGRYRAIADLVEAGDHKTLLTAAAAIPPPDPLADEPRWTSRFAELLATADPTRLARVFRGATTADLPAEEAVAAIDVPVLILAWTGDPGHPASAAARLQELMPHAELALAATPAGLASWTRRISTFLQTIGG